jgi:hypothetical protein
LPVRYKGRGGQLPSVERRSALRRTSRPHSNNTRAVRCERLCCARCGEWAVRPHRRPAPRRGNVGAVVVRRRLSGRGRHRNEDPCVGSGTAPIHAHTERDLLRPVFTASSAPPVMGRESTWRQVSDPTRDAASIRIGRRWARPPPRGLPMARGWPCGLPASCTYLEPTEVPCRRCRTSRAILLRLRSGLPGV